jgi:hypothetical protein
MMRQIKVVHEASDQRPHIQTCGTNPGTGHNTSGTARMFNQQSLMKIVA